MSARNICKVVVSNNGMYDASMYIITGTGIAYALKPQVEADEHDVVFDLTKVAGLRDGDSIQVRVVSGQAAASTDPTNFTYTRDLKDVAAFTLAGTAHAPLISFQTPLCTPAEPANCTTDAEPCTTSPSFSTPSEHTETTNDDSASECCSPSSCSSADIVDTCNSTDIPCLDLDCADSASAHKECTGDDTQTSAAECCSPSSPAESMDVTCNSTDIPYLELDCSDPTLLSTQMEDTDECCHSSATECCSPTGPSCAESVTDTAAAACDLDCSSRTATPPIPLPSAHTDEGFHSSTTDCCSPTSSYCESAIDAFDSINIPAPELDYPVPDPTVRVPSSAHMKDTDGDFNGPAADFCPPIISSSMESDTHPSSSTDISGLEPNYSVRTPTRPAPLNIENPSFHNPGSESDPPTISSSAENVIDAPNSISGLERDYSVRTPTQPDTLPSTQMEKTGNSFNTVAADYHPRTISSSIQSVIETSNTSDVPDLELDSSIPIPNTPKRTRKRRSSPTLWGETLKEDVFLDVKGLKKDAKQLKTLLLVRNSVDLTQRFTPTTPSFPAPDAAELDKLRGDINETRYIVVQIQNQVMEHHDEIAQLTSEIREAASRQAASQKTMEDMLQHILSTQATALSYPAVDGFELVNLRADINETRDIVMQIQNRNEITQLTNEIRQMASRQAASQKMTEDILQHIISKRLNQAPDDFDSKLLLKRSHAESALPGPNGVAIEPSFSMRRTPQQTFIGSNYALQQASAASVVSPTQGSLVQVPTTSAMQYMQYARARAPPTPSAVPVQIPGGRLGEMDFRNETDWSRMTQNFNGMNASSQAPVFFMLAPGNPSQESSLLQTKHHLYWRTLPSSTPISLYYRVISKKPNGEEVLEATNFTCSSDPAPQSRSSREFHEGEGKLLRPHALSKSATDMGSVRLEVQRINGTVHAVWKNGQDKLRFIDEKYPWVVFEFNFQRCGDDQPAPNFAKNKRKREMLPNFTKSKLTTSSGPKAKKHRNTSQPDPQSHFSSTSARQERRVLSLPQTPYTGHADSSPNSLFGDFADDHASVNQQAPEGPPSFRETSANVHNSSASVAKGPSTGSNIPRTPEPASTSETYDSAIEREKEQLRKEGEILVAEIIKEKENLKRRRNKKEIAQLKADNQAKQEELEKLRRSAWEY
ncbi:hypothetical protein BDP27DRAFT_1424222 [Rhodocollybia butyracea]|uniref:Uncharacterized protein n=1 Tax=Rhodocollybia butyracea TaxID=206335 RepID=A0A9P5U4Y1_9AGAR|nr:hypothetical protein BDP27DRAFT_1424222 [Rhodocollybia butyracea]